MNRDELKVSNPAGLELTISTKFIPPNIINNVRGGSNLTPTWDEYLAKFQEDHRPHLELIRKGIEAKNWVGESGDPIANHWNFFFNDGEVMGFSLNAWGDLMQSIVGKREGFRKYNK